MKGRPCFTTNSSPPTARGPSRPTRGRRARTTRISSSRGVRSIRRCATSSPSADGAPATSSSASSTDKCHCQGSPFRRALPDVRCNLIRRGVWRAYFWIHTNSLSCTCFRGMFRGVSRNYKFQNQYYLWWASPVQREKLRKTTVPESRFPLPGSPRCLFTGREKRKSGRCFTANV